MKPVDDVGRLFGVARGSRFRISALSEITVTSPKPISDFLERVKSTIADCLLVGAAGDEIATAPFVPSPAAASGHDEFENFLPNVDQRYERAPYQC